MWAVLESVTSSLEPQGAEIKELLHQNGNSETNLEHCDKDEETIEQIKLNSRHPEQFSNPRAIKWLSRDQTGPSSSDSPMPPKLSVRILELLKVVY